MSNIKKVKIILLITNNLEKSEREVIFKVKITSQLVVWTKYTFVDNVQFSKDSYKIFTGEINFQECKNIKKCCFSSVIL